MEKDADDKLSVYCVRTLLLVLIYVSIILDVYLILASLLLVESRFDEQPKSPSAARISPLHRTLFALYLIISALFDLFGVAGILRRSLLMILFYAIVKSVLSTLSLFAYAPLTILNVLLLFTIAIISFGLSFLLAREGSDTHHDHQAPPAPGYILS